MSDNTVYALSTAAGKSGVAVFRVSGSDALAVVRCLTALDAGAVVPRHAYFTSLHDLAGEVLDHALVLYFKAPASFTGEDTVEIHSHGSRAVIAAVLETSAGWMVFGWPNRANFPNVRFTTAKWI